MQLSGQLVRGGCHCQTPGGPTGSAARIARSARRTSLHLSAAWRWAIAWPQLFTTTGTPPAAA